MVCVCVKGEPIIGIIYNPFTKNTVWAWKDKATSQNLMNIKTVNLDRIINKKKINQKYITGS